MDLDTRSDPPSQTTGAGESTPDFKHTGPEHFSPLSDVSTNKYAVPPCACGEPSFGGVLVAQLAGGKSGGPVFDLEFRCHWCNLNSPYSWTVLSSALHPHYQLISGHGHRRIYRRLTREQAIQRVTA